MSKRRYLVSAYYSEWVEADNERDAEDILTDSLATVKARDFSVEVQEEDELAE